MFTGIISDIGSIASVEPMAGGFRITVSCSYDPGTIFLGASIACAGVCLTVSKISDNKYGCDFSAEVSQATLSCTTLGRLGNADRINLERSLKIGDELGGHLVQGHVDGVALIEHIGDEGESRRVRFKAPGPLIPFIAPKGSIVLDGTSLTVNMVDIDVFEVNIIPYTLNVTTWAERMSGDAVNLEIDLLARYIARYEDTRIR
jgi:riboflavin synthase